MQLLKAMKVPPPNKNKHPIDLESYVKKSKIKKSEQLLRCHNESSHCQLELERFKCRQNVRNQNLMLCFPVTLTELQLGRSFKRAFIQGGTDLCVSSLSQRCSHPICGEL